jgi:hypothetical protein
MFYFMLFSFNLELRARQPGHFYVQEFTAGVLTKRVFRLFTYILPHEATCLFYSFHLATLSTVTHVCK